MANIKKNFAYNSVLTLSTYVINLFLFPYVARVLGVDIVGKISFVNNVISYFSLFALLGLPILGIREIAACQGNREKRSEVFSSLIFIILCSTILLSTIYIVSIFIVERFFQVRELFFLGLFLLVSTSFSIEWFFQGVEDFKFVTVRTLLVKLIYFFLVIFFIKSQDDYCLYYLMSVLVVFVNAIISVIYTKQYVDISFKKVKIQHYIKSSLSFGLYRVILSMYITFNVVYLGFLCSDTEVGYYYTATKLLTIAMGVLTAFTNVMMPRMSNLLSEGKMYEFQTAISKSFDLVLSLSFPIAIGLAVLAPQIIRVLAGEGYEGAIVPMRIVMFNVLSIGISQIYVLQILIPQKKDKVVLISSIWGLIAGVTLNILLVSRLAAIGSAITLIISEFAGDSYNYYYVSKKKLINSPLPRILKYLFFSIPYVLFFYVPQLISDNNVIILVSSIVMATIYFIVLHRNIIRGTVLSDLIRRYI